MSQKKNEGIPFSAEIRVVGSYTDRLLRRIRAVVMLSFVAYFETLLQLSLYLCQFTCTR